MVASLETNLQEAVRVKFVTFVETRTRIDEIFIFATDCDFRNKI